jgi:hypothetical protein
MLAPFGENQGVTFAAFLVQKKGLLQIISSVFFTGN